MDFARPMLELASLFISLALVGLVLSRSQETATVVQASAGAFSTVLNAATMHSSAPITSRYRR